MLPSPASARLWRSPACLAGFVVTFSDHAIFAFTNPFSMMQSAFSSRHYVTALGLAVLVDHIDIFGIGPVGRAIDKSTLHQDTTAEQAATGEQTGVNKRSLLSVARTKGAAAASTRLSVDHAAMEALLVKATCTGIVALWLSRYCGRSGCNMKAISHRCRNEPIHLVLRHQGGQYTRRTVCRDRVRGHQSTPTRPTIGTAPGPSN